MLMDSKIVCIVIPVYNVKPYIKRCIKSILAQTIANYEVLLIDDGSTDGSADLCDLISQKYKKIITYHKPNGGAGSARNYGIEKALEKNYQYIAFVDPDDTLEPYYLEILMNTIEEDNADMAICGYKSVSYRNGKVVDEKVFNNALEGGFKDFAEELCMLHDNTLLFSVWNKLFRLSLIHEHGIKFGNTKRLEDAVFVYRYLQFAMCIAFSSSIIYNYSLYYNGRTTATKSFLNEYCKGSFYTYINGQNVVKHMTSMNMNSDAVELFSKRIKRHFQSCLIGEMIVSLSFSSLTWKERKNYIKVLIKKYHKHFCAFDTDGKCGIDRIAREMANRGFLDEIVLLSYLYHIKKKIVI